MDDIVAEGPDVWRRLEIVLVLGHDLDDPDDQVASALPRGLGRRQEARSREAGLGGRGSDGAQYQKRRNYNTTSERVTSHCSSSGDDFEIRSGPTYQTRLPANAHA